MQRSAPFHGDPSGVIFYFPDRYGDQMKHLKSSRILTYFTSLLMLTLLSACGNDEELAVPIATKIALSKPAISNIDNIVPRSTVYRKAALAPSFPVGKGVIIPAYLTLDDAYAWNVLKEGAQTMSASTQSSYKDYWVVVNSADNGPFLNQNDWAKAKTVWDPIRANGGRIFGYVHAVQSPDASIPDGRLYRDINTVKAEITSWVNGYSDLDGIWIDEFYPRYEIAQPEAGAALVYPRDYPNGAANAPIDTGFINSQGQFNGRQVEPAGGYYSQLTTWIRSTYPHLRIIGNAGGDMYSNQYKYGDLVDVLVSFEQNFDYAYVTGIQNWDSGTLVETEKYQWHGLDRLNQITTAPGVLALVHGNSGNMALAIDQAFSHGYTHVYTTDRILQNNIWGGLPQYLSSEIKYIAEKP